MSTIGIMTTMKYEYQNGAVTTIGQRNLIICDTYDVYGTFSNQQTGQWDPGQYTSRSIEQCQGWLSASGMTLFGVGHFQPLDYEGTIRDAVPYRDPKELVGLKYPFTDLVQLYENDVEYIHFEFTTSDGTQRTISLHMTDCVDEDGIFKYVRYNWIFSKNGTPYIAWEANVANERYSRNSNTQINVHDAIASIPWLHNIHYSGGSVGETFGQFESIIDYHQVKVGKKWEGVIDDPNQTGIYFQLNSTGSAVAMFNNWVQGFTPEPYVPTPYPPDPGGTHQPGDDEFKPNPGGDTDKPGVDPLPGISATGSGFATIFKPSVSQLRSLANKMWNGDILHTIRNLIENVNDLFVSLAMVPFNVPAGNTVSVMFLNILDTGVSLTLAAQQFIELDMGTINLAADNRVYSTDTALDYSPYSRIGIYLPFIGYRDIDIDEVRKKPIQLRYRIDILSGACVAIVRVDGADLYQFSGNCLTQIPITQQSISSLISDAVNLACAVVAPVEIGAAAAGAEIAKMDSVSAIGAHNITTEKVGEAFESSSSSLQSATVNSIMGMKPMYPKTGSVSGACSMITVKQPYLYLVTPRQAYPEDYGRYCGYPSNISGALSSFSGFTVVEDIRLNGLTATAPEVAEIYELLKKGVII